MNIKLELLDLYTYCLTLNGVSSVFVLDKDRIDKDLNAIIGV